MERELSKQEIIYNNIIQVLIEGVSDSIRRSFEYEKSRIEKSVLRDDYTEMIKREERMLRHWKKRKNRYKNSRKKREMCEENIQWEIEEIEEQKRLLRFQQRLKSELHKT